MGSLATLSEINQRYARNDDIFFEDVRDFEKVIQTTFNAVTTSSHQSRLGHLTDEYRRLLQNHNINLPDTAYLNNALKPLIIQYITNFKNNILTHKKRNVIRLFKLWHLMDNNNARPKKRESKVWQRAATFMFNPFTQVARNDAIIRRFLNYCPIDIDMADTFEPGFMNFYINKTNWNNAVHLFLTIQRDIDQYQERSIETSQPMRLTNFNVVPIHHWRRKHIRIDSGTLHQILYKLKLDPRKESPNKRGCTVKLSFTEFKNALDEDEFGTYNPHWFDYFDRAKIIKLQGPRVNSKKQFDYSIVTDGEAVSVQFRSLTKKPNLSFEQLKREQEEKIQLFRKRYQKHEYDIEIGMDTN